MDAESGRILYGKEEQTPRPMASTTKIMTCLLALEQSSPSEEVSFSSRAVSMPKVHLGASKGSSFTMKAHRQICAGLLPTPAKTKIS